MNDLTPNEVMDFINSRLMTSPMTQVSNNKFTFTMDDPTECNTMVEFFRGHREFKDQAENIRYQYLHKHWTPTVTKDEDEDGEVTMVVTMERTAVGTTTAKVNSTETGSTVLTSPIVAEKTGTYEDISNHYVSTPK